MDRHEEALNILKSGTAIPAIPLSLDENRNFDRDGQKLLVKYYLNSNAGGIAAAVHTTQFEIRKPEFNLLEPVLQTVSEEIDEFEKAKNKTAVKIAGVCGETEQAVQEAKLAKKYGYDAVLLSPGGLNDKPEKYMIERTKKIAEVIPVIGFYLQTACGGRQFTYKYWEEICKIKNVIAIKCASFNRYTTLDVVRAAALAERDEPITLYTGNDDNIIIDLLTKFRFKKNGREIIKTFDGGLLGHWSVWTKKSVEIFFKIKKERDTLINDELLTLAAEVTDANAAFFDTANGFKGCIAGLHYVLKKQGLMKNIYCLNPGETLSYGQMEEIERVMACYPHLSDDTFVAENIEKWKSEIKR